MSYFFPLCMSSKLALYVIRDMDITNSLILKVLQVDLKSEMYHN